VYIHAGKTSGLVLVVWLCCKGLLFAVNHGAQVVNISAGMSFADEVASWPVDRQIEMARRELLAQEDVWKYVFDMCDKYRVTIVWAAGNENIFTALDASKRGQNTIKVSSVDRDFSKSSFSNFGNFPERRIYESTVSAPGAKVYGELPARRGCCCRRYEFLGTHSCRCRGLD